jgi:ornithine cyclodeaminase/alanine dehydrogenase
MAEHHRFLYLSRADVEAVDCPPSAIMAAVELAFREKAAGRTIMPPKHWLAPSSRRFFSAMASALPGSGAAGCKWQSGSPDNAAASRPYLTGQYILNALDTGMPLAIMDSTWITEVRTAAASAVVSRYLVGRPPAVLAMLGCGLQAKSRFRSHGSPPP